MPPHNIVLASGAAVAVSVAVATAIALYESPELRRYADDVRRRIAMALHSIGDGINPPHREPLFNRPEDAHGFMQSRSGEGAEPGVDADDETRRRQREELLYWNSVRLQKEKEKADNEKNNLDDEKIDETIDEKRPLLVTRGSSFDDFLQPDASAEKGTYVFNSGADTAGHQNGLRHRGDGARGISSSILSNPFADEHFIGASELVASQNHDSEPDHIIAPSRDETVSDIYSATTAEPQTPIDVVAPEPSLIDLDQPTPARSESSATMDRDLDSDEFMTAGQDDRTEAYASIQAWAQTSQPSFYSPLPSTPTVPQSEPELLSDGQLTPTDSTSLAGSGEDIANDALSSRDGETGRPFDVLSESDGIMTPASWSEVGSVVSESETPGQVPA